MLNRRLMLKEQVWRGEGDAGRRKSKSCSTGASPARKGREGSRRVEKGREGSRRVEMGREAGRLSVEVLPRTATSTLTKLLSSVLECCFTSTKTVDLLGTGAQDVHLDFHTAPEFWWLCSYLSSEGPAWCQITSDATPPSVMKCPPPFVTLIA